MITTIIAFIIIFGILVFVHEFGHFIMAKKLGVLVREFSIGMGPKLFEHTSNGTKYTIRLLPVGGYVRMAGDFDKTSVRPGSAATLKLDKNNQVKAINMSNKHQLFKGLPIEVTSCDTEHKLQISGYVNGNENKKKTFKINHDAMFVHKNGYEEQIAPADVQYTNAPAYKKLLINFAGIFNNALLAVIAFALLTFLRGGVMTNTNQINVLPHNSVARQVGIKSGSRITAINNHPTKTFDALGTQISKRPKKRINVTVNYHHHIQHFNLKTKAMKNGSQTTGIIGISQVLDKNPLEEASSGFTSTWNITKLLYNALYRMVTGHFHMNDLGGPVAIFATTHQAAKLGGVIGLIGLLAFLSINLAIMNCLPIPALDGGKIILDLYEIIFRRQVPRKVTIAVTACGAVFLILLMVLVTWNDIFRFFIK